MTNKLSRLLFCVVLVGLTSAWVVAQDSTNAKSKGEVRTITGCLSKGDNANEYLLASSDGSTWEVRCNNAVELASHVGQTIEAKGVVDHAKMHNMKEDAKDMAKDSGMKKNNTEHGHLKVTERPSGQRFLPASRNARRLKIRRPHFPHPVREMGLLFSRKESAVTRKTPRADLPPHADLRKRQHRAARRRTSHRQRRTEGRENQHPLDLRQHFLRLVRIRQNPVILHAPVCIHVRFDHQRIGVDRIQRHAKRALLQLRRGIHHHQRHIIARLQRSPAPRNTPSRFRK